MPIKIRSFILCLTATMISLISSTLLLTGCANREAAAEFQPLSADFSVTAKNLIVKNGDTFVWENAEIKINHRYVYKTRYLPRGRSSIPFKEFTGPDGTFFIPGLWNVRNIEIIVPDAGNGKPGKFRW